MTACVLNFFYAGYLRLPIDAGTWSTSRYVLRLYIHECTHACTHAHIHTHTHTESHSLTHSHTHEHMHAYTHERAQTCLSAHTDMFFSLQKCVGGFVLFLLCVCVCVCVFRFRNFLSFDILLNLFKQIFLSISVILSGVTWHI